MIPVCVLDSPGYANESQALATQLSLPLIANPACAPHSIHLRYHEDCLQLIAPAGAQGSGPVMVDFVHGKLAHRLRFGGGKGQAIARAVGFKAKQTPTILDATAGLGQDGLILASLGCTVHMIEKHPVVVALLNDGLRRARLDHALSPIIQRMTLSQADAVEWMSSASTDTQHFDSVYLDPMYPANNSRALTQKGMHTLQQLLGHEPAQQTDQLLHAARDLARKRVVLKRPTRVAPMTDPKPAFCIQGKTTRYDVWLPANPTSPIERVTLQG